ncbi:MAG: DNA gyrase subunit A [Candidatus Woesearchaeota archaeon]
MADNNEKPEEDILLKRDGTERILPAVIEDEMKSAYLSYSMSVIVGRALPDIRDGLKPVHRRILYAMNELGITHSKSYKKSARIVGEVLGKYHPHGDSAVYDTLVRMAQTFSMRYPLIRGQGNFGSVDGDSAAAMRYTEAKLEKISDEMLADIDKDTVDMRENFDGSLKEPEVLPTKVPNLLINGSNGIAVGMATNIPPHNLSEVAEATKQLIKDPEKEALDLVEYIQGPDFPTGGTIIGRSGYMNAYKTGRGKLTLRAVMHEEKVRNREALVVTEIPYQVNKSMLLEQIAKSVRDKRIEGISDIRDESDKKGLRVVIELKKDANTEVVQNQLLKHSRLQVSMGIIFLTIDKGKPKVLDIKQILEAFIKHRRDVIRRRSSYELDKAEKRAHILEGLTKALDHIDPIITLIKKAQGTKEAIARLQREYEFSEQQAQAILDMKLQKLTGLEREKLKEDHKAILKRINELKEILGSIEKVNKLIIEELDELQATYGDERRTKISQDEYNNIEDEDLIPQEEQVVSITKAGYAKRIPIDAYKIQKRGGKGVIGTGMKEEDVVKHLFTANTHSYLLIITDKGRVHWLKIYNIPEGTRQSKGKALINMVQLDQGEHIATVIPVKSFDKDWYLTTITKQGTIKKTSLEAYSRPRQTGIIGISLDKGDRVVQALKTSGDEDLLIATRQGQAVRFSELDVRAMGRTSRGVRAIRLAQGDQVIGAIKARPEASVLTVTDNGYGKQTPVSEYRKTARGGKGVKNIICDERNGLVANIKEVTGDEEALLISHRGIIIRMAVKHVSKIGRSTKGVRLMRLTEGDQVKTIALITPEQLNGQDEKEPLPEE